GIVDNLIQRNPVTKIPVIHSSGIKGALNDYFEQIKYDKNNRIKLFGDEGKEGESFPGRLIFFEANLLFLPLRSNKKLFYYATSPFVIKEFISFIKDFTNKDYKTEMINGWMDKIKFNEDIPFYTFDTGSIPEIEDFRSDKKGVNTKEIKDEIEKLTGLNLEDIALFNDDYFNKICERSIPVIARNKIGDDGESENLFYEEVLPRKSVLYFVLGEENNLLGADYENFIQVLTADGTIVQFGGNYSVGYGFCKVKELKLS
ncbi:MAG: type III-B CRISPR module RAMP protein Cmr4, partial [Actinobacteria bacterium]|nr:type III-B CRISPR module RAMP protein Cmr4 [Actinomycetota bacterium]